MINKETYFKISILLSILNIFSVYDFYCELEDVIQNMCISIVSKFRRPCVSVWADLVKEVIISYIQCMLQVR